MKVSSLSPEHFSNPTEHKIVEAAIKIFSQKGYSGSTTKEIAKEAGVSEATIFRYFDTKKDLLLALVSPTMVKSVADLFLDIEGKTLDEILYNFLKSNTELIEDNKDLLKIVLFEALFHPEIKERLYQEIINQKATQLEQFFEVQKKNNGIKDVEPKVATLSLLGMLMSYHLWKIAFDDAKTHELNEENVIKDFIEIFSYGIKN